MSTTTDGIATNDADLPARAAPKTLRLETDTFCQHCHYNLFSQEVVEDERLQIMICRCPECGKFHPAGHGVSSSKIWLNRFGMFMLVVWVLFCLSLVSVGSVILGGMQYGYLEDFTNFVSVTPDGQPVVQTYLTNKLTWVVAGTGWTVAPVVVFRRIIQYHRGYDDETPEWERLLPYFLVSGIAAISLGLLFSVAFWHWKRRGLWALLLPILVGGFIFAIWHNERGVSSILGWSIEHIALWTLFDVAMLGVGLIFGRRIARLIVSLVIPPKPRQHFAFLWAADGKNWPLA